MSEKFIMCAKCVLDNVEVPDITFDAVGVCNYCREWEAREMKRKFAMSDLPWIYERMRHEGRSSGRKYDVLLGLSGGVDSSLCLHHLVANGIKPYCFSVDNGYNDPKADENIMRLVEGLGVPFHRFVLNLDRFKDLQKAFLKSGVKNIEIPTDHVLMAATYQLAAKNGIRHIVGGGNHATEGIMPAAYGYQARDLRHIQAIYQRAYGHKLTGLPTISLPQYLWYRFGKRITITNLLDYYEYDRRGAIALLAEKYGYQDYGEKHCENLFTSWFQSFYLPTKWRLDKRKPHYSSLINSGQMTKKDALEELAHAPIYPEFGIEERVRIYQPREHSDYPTNERLWNFLSRLYGIRPGKK